MIPVARLRVPEKKPFERTQLGFCSNRLAMSHPSTVSWVNQLDLDATPTTHKCQSGHAHTEALLADIVPKKRIVVALEVDVMSANDVSGRTMTAMSRKTSCAVLKAPSSALIGSD